MNLILDRAETISNKNIERVKALNGGIAILHRMAYQGEYFLNVCGEIWVALALFRFLTHLPLKNDIK